MKVNKTIIIGLISIVIGGIILTSDILNPIIRPVTHLFLMGSSKGKDILFFGLLGLFLIIPQLKRIMIPRNTFRYQWESVGFY